MFSFFHSQSSNIMNNISKKSLALDVKNIYNNPKLPASYSGLNKIYQLLKKKAKYKNLKYSDLKKVLSKEETYQMYKSSKKTFPRRKVITSYLNDQWDIDLIDMSSFAKENDNIKYLLTIIDIFSRYAYVYPLRSKSQEEIISAMKNILKQNKPDNIRSDKGGEFTGTKIKKYFQDNNINHFVTQNDQIKSNYIERLNRTLKNKLFKYMYHNQTHRYLDVINDIVNSYNNTTHASINMKPKDVNKQNELNLWARQYLKQGKKKKLRKPFYQYNIGDYVRISRFVNIFTRDYDQKWTGEIFRIINRNAKEGFPIYDIEDYDGEPIIGSFYEPELQKVEVDKDQIFKIDKVLQTKTKNKIKMHLVSWLSWPKKYNSWIKDADLTDINKLKGNRK